MHSCVQVPKRLRVIIWQLLLLLLLLLSLPLLLPLLLLFLFYCLPFRVSIFCDMCFTNLFLLIRHLSL